jgi:formylglycine-generating enzyme required for sulfatase activity
VTERLCRIAAMLVLFAAPVNAQDTAFFQECDLCPEMAVIPPGTFVMGSPDDEADREENEGPQREVTITRPFALARTEVTVGQYAAFVAATGYQAADQCPNSVVQRLLGAEPAIGNWRAHFYPLTDDHPVACVTRTDALAYIDWLSQQTGAPYRLPSEAEWEYAAREGGAAPPGEAATLCQRANTADEALTRDADNWEFPYTPCDDGFGMTAALVGSYAANAFGLYDMAGNVWEYTQDCYAERYPDAPTDGSAYETEDCPRRTVRGGSWINGPGTQGGDGEHRPANRGRNSPGMQFDNMGFRVTRDL